jgi:hypothetical protein
MDGWTDGWMDGWMHGCMIDARIMPNHRMVKFSLGHMPSLSIILLPYISLAISVYKIHYHLLSQLILIHAKNIDI